MKPILRSVKIIVFGVCLAAVIAGHEVHAEGTKEIMPNNINGTGLIVSTTTTFPLGNVGNYLNCPADNRIYFNIKDYTKENLYYGFHWVTLAPSGKIITYSDVYMRIYSPAGVLITTLNLPTAGAGFISTYANAVSGPNIGGATPAGYTPLVFTPTQNGNYWVELYRSSDGGNTEIAGGESMLSSFFDLTVAQTNNTQFPGRVHCNKWAFTVFDPATNLQSPFLSSQAQYFAYTSDSVTTKIDFQSGFRPLAFIVAVNNYGVQNTGNWLNDRKSVNSTSLPALSNGYNVFLNPPDPILYPPSAVPSPPSLVSPIIAGCPPGPYNVRFNAPQDGDYYILLDLNGVPGFQAGTADRFFELINQVKGIITIVWDGKDGLGVPVPPNTTFPITFSFRKGRINVPLYDVELNVNGFNVAAISPIALPKSRLYWDDSQVSVIGDGTCSSTTNNFNNTAVGSVNNIVGQVSPGHAWNGDGNLAFAIPAPAVAGNDVDNLQCNDFGNARLINTWAWGIELYVTQNLTLGCINVSGTVWNDADNSAKGTFTNIRTNSEPGTNAGNSLYAMLIDPVTGNIMSSAPVNADGTYTLPNCPINATGLQVQISTTPGIVGTAKPAFGLPGGWLNMSPLTQTFNTGSTNVTGLDFGIERLPDSDPKNYTIPTPALNSYLTLNGPGLPSLPGPLSGNDAEDGTMGGGKKVVITQVPTIGELYYNGVLVTNNTVINNYNPALLQVKFTSLTVFSISFQYAFVDAGSLQDPTPATYTINWSSLLIHTFTLFTAKSTNNSVVLQWQLEDESKGLQHIIERSADGSSFETVGSIGGDDTDPMHHYSFTDNDPVSGTSSYYRIKLVDKTGSVVYSNIVVVMFSNKLATSVFPNPFKDEVAVKFNLAATGKVVLRLMNDKGMVLQQTQYEGSKGQNTYHFRNLSSLPVSVYFIAVVLPDQTIVKKVFNQ